MSGHPYLDLNITCLHKQKVQKVQNKMIETFHQKNAKKCETVG
jgi:hypothetical protein